MYGDPLIVVLVLVLGCAAFFFTILYAGCQLLTAMWRGMWHLMSPSKGDSPPHGAGHSAFVQVCPREHCRKVESRAARYCGQCGAKFREAPAGRR